MASETVSTQSWSPEQYMKFGTERTQPAIDLARRVRLAAPRRVLDVGCGPGNSTQVLRARWPQAEIIGLDSSAEMLEKARAADGATQWLLRDAAGDLSDLGMFDVVFSNAALQWMPDNRALIARLFERIAPGGALAVQVPYTKPLPLYTEIQRLIKLPAWRAAFEGKTIYPLHQPAEYYYDALSPLTDDLALWQTDYMHIMQGHEGIVAWYRGTGLRPYLEQLDSDAAREAFLAAYLAAIESVYARRADGRVLLPFRRIFFIAYARGAA